jgi:hypothetical protein
VMSLGCPDDYLICFTFALAWLHVRQPCSGFRFAVLFFHVLSIR